MQTPVLAVLPDTRLQMEPEAGPTELANIELKKIRIYKGQPRIYFNDEKLKELAESISATGQANPGRVKVLNPPVDGYEYELISGERRFRACLLANVRYFRAEIDRTPMSEREQYIKAITCNSDQEPLSPTENAIAIQKLKALGLSDFEISKVMSQSVSWVAKYYSLLRLSPEVFTMMGPEVEQEKRLSFGIATLLLQVPDAVQALVAKEILDRNLSATQAQEFVKKTLRSGGFSRERRPHREFLQFAGFINRTNEQIQAILDTPNPEFRITLAHSSGLQARMQAFETIEGLIPKFIALKEKYELIMRQRENVT